MWNKEKDILVYFNHMLELSRKAVSMIEGKNPSDYFKDETLKLALTHLVQTIGEAARNIPYDIQKNYPSIPWKDIVGMRNKLVHDYMAVDEEIVWLTVKNRLPKLIAHLEVILSSG